MARKANSEKAKCVKGYSDPLMAFLATWKADMAFKGHDLAIPASHDTAEYRASWPHNLGMKTKYLSSAIALPQTMGERCTQRSCQSWLQKMLCNASAACASLKHARRATISLAMPCLTAMYALGSRAL